MDWYNTPAMRLVGFQWDKGNSTKNSEKHGVTGDECEQVFFNQPLAIFKDRTHSQGEERYRALGITNGGRRLFIVFTIRDNLIRVISARDQDKQERQEYEMSQAVLALRKQRPQKGDYAKK